MSAHASKKAIYAAFAANAGIALGKFLGAGFTGSTAMLSEGIHSLVDTGNQLLLLFGIKEAARPADADHPLGYGMRIWVVGLLVAMVVFALGGGVAIYEGIKKIGHPEPIQHAWVNVLILIFAIILEGSSLTVVLKQVSLEAEKRGTDLLETIRRHRDPAVFAIVYEETAALAGLAVALIGIAFSVALDMPVIDGWTSVVIGGILGFTSLALGAQCYQLMTGQAADPAIEDKLREILGRIKPVDHVNEVRTMHFGPNEVLVLASVDFQDDLPASGVEKITSDVAEGLREIFPEVKRVYIECQSNDRHLEALEDIGEEPDALDREDEDAEA